MCKHCLQKGQCLFFIHSFMKICQMKILNRPIDSSSIDWESQPKTKPAYFSFIQGPLKIFTEHPILFYEITTQEDLRENPRTKPLDGFFSPCCYLWYALIIKGVFLMFYIDWLSWCKIIKVITNGSPKMYQSKSSVPSISKDVLALVGAEVKVFFIC